MKKSILIITLLCATKAYSAENSRHSEKINKDKELLSTVSSFGYNVYQLWNTF